MLSAPRATHTLDPDDDSSTAKHADRVLADAMRSFMPSWPRAPQRESKVHAHDLAYPDVTRGIVGAAVHLVGLVVLVAAIVYVTRWEHTTYVSCRADSEETVARARELRDTWCLDMAADSRSRQLRSAYPQCIEAHAVVRDGAEHMTLDCMASAHIAHFGRCRDFVLCESVVLWIDTLRQHLWLALVAVTIVALYWVSRTYNSTVANAAHARELASAYMTRSALLPTHAGFVGGKVE